MPLGLESSFVLEGSSAQQDLNNMKAADAQQVWLLFERGLPVPGGGGEEKLETAKRKFWKQPAVLAIAVWFGVHQTKLIHLSWHQLAVLVFALRSPHVLQTCVQHSCFHSFVGQHWEGLGRRG